MDDVYEISGFFHSDNGDREYDDDFLAEWVASFIGNGVYKTELAVIAGQGMQITVDPGRAWVKGRYYRNKPNRPAIPIENADGVYNRYASVMIRQDLNERKNRLVVVYSELSANPTPPAPVRTAEVYDIKLAHIYIPRGSVSITQERITDTRLDTSVCGLVTGVVTQVPTETLYLQIQAELASFKANEEAAFNAWFAELQEFLSEQEILALKPMVEAIYPKATARVSGNKVIITSEQVKTSTSYDVQFNTPEAFSEARTFEIDGTTVTVKDTKNAALKDNAWGAGVPITLSRRGNTAFFKAGGGEEILGHIIVTGATRPSATKNGTVWVKTTKNASDIKIIPASFMFSAQDPEGTYSAVTTQATDLKRGDIALALDWGFCGQYGGAQAIPWAQDFKVAGAALESKVAVVGCVMAMTTDGMGVFGNLFASPVYYEVYNNGTWYEPGNIIFYKGICPHGAVGVSFGKNGNTSFGIGAATNLAGKISYGGLLYRLSATSGIAGMGPDANANYKNSVYMSSASSQSTQVWGNVDSNIFSSDGSDQRLNKLTWSITFDYVNGAGKLYFGNLSSPSTAYLATGEITAAGTYTIPTGSTFPTVRTSGVKQVAFSQLSLHCPSSFTAA